MCWIGNGLPDIGARGPVQDRGRSMRAQDRIKAFPFVDVTNFQRTPFDGFAVTAVEVIVGDGIETGAGKALQLWQPHIAGPAATSTEVIRYIRVRSSSNPAHQADARSMLSK